jgi:hypothetical protein
MRKHVSLAIGLLFSIGLAHSAWADNAATRWISHALEVVRTTNQSTQAAGRIYALTGVAMYDAVDGIERERLKSVAGPARGKIREQALVRSEGAPVLGDRRTAETIFRSRSREKTGRCGHITRFSQAADEMGRSRIFNRIHFQFSNVSGRQAGDAIGTEVITTSLRPEGACRGVHCACP